MIIYHLLNAQGFGIAAQVNTGGLTGANLANESLTVVQRLTSHAVTVLLLHQCLIHTHFVV